MHRVLAMLLLCLVSFGLMAPALSASAALQLPQCCRAKGKHHCAMRTASFHQRGADFGVYIHGLAEKCPCGPKLGALASGSPTFFPAPSQAFFSGVVSHPANQAQTEARYRIAFSRSRQKRGPPALLS